ncbi:DUF5011 domain-containing protein, partial [Candidatus Kaiserbacteria bacterium]|nr:DUF5011 domain-containing protein [Candidatus Kaiserbacteria bacterium]
NGAPLDMYVSGDVGVGTTTPWAKLSVNQFNGGSTPMFVVASSTGSGATSTAFIIDKNGNVGVGTTSPWRTFSVVGTVAFNGLTTGSSVRNAICLTAAKDVIDSGTTACTSSSLRFKENVETLPQHFALDTLDQLRVVSFDYKEGYYSPEDRARSYGLIAEEVQQIDPTLVDFGYDGLAQSLKFEKLTGLTIQGIQEINLNLETIASTTASSTPQSRSFTTSFFGNVFSRLTQWFADTANGIGKFFAKEVHTDTLCVSDSSGETCITKAQLDALLAGAASAQGAPASQGGGSSGGGGSSTPAPVEEPTPAPDTEAPTITINGNNPATIEVGSTYADLGASVTDNVDNNLGIKASVDGGAEIELGTITIDTSAAGTHTIEYRATDQAGNTGTATRTVTVESTVSAGSGEASPPPAAAPATEPDPVAPTP